MFCYTFMVKALGYIVYDEFSLFSVNWITVEHQSTVFMIVYNNFIFSITIYKEHVNISYILTSLP